MLAPFCAFYHCLPSEFWDMDHIDCLRLDAHRIAVERETQQQLAGLHRG